MQRARAPDAAAPRDAASRPWILGPWRDGLLFVGTPLLILPLVAAARTRLSAAEIGLYVATFGATGHHLPGLLRAYGDRDLFTRFRTRFVVAPLMLLAGCFALAYRDMEALSLVVLVWGTWHGLAQVYGIARIYDTRVGVRGAARLDLALCVAWFGAGLVHSPGRLSALLESLYAAGAPLLAPEWIRGFQGAWSVATGLVTCAFAVNVALALARGERTSPVKIALYASSFAFWWFAMVEIESVVLGVALFEVFHDVQYLTITWIYGANRAERSRAIGGFSRFLFRRRPEMVAMYVLLAFLYGHAIHLPGAYADARLESFLTALVATSALLHFYYDGFIWKVRERTTREGLGLAGGRTATPLVPGVVHAAKWALVAAPLALLALSSADPGGALERARSVAAAVPGSAAARAHLGRQLLEAGRPDEAVSELRLAVQLDRGPREPVGLLVMALAASDRVAEALDLYREAADRLGEHTEVLGRLAGALRRAGRLDEALAFRRDAARVAVDADERFRARYEIGATLAAAGRSEQAIATFRALLAERPESWQVHASLAALLSGEGNQADALRHRRRARQLRPRAGSV